MPTPRSTAPARLRARLASPLCVLAAMALLSGCATFGRRATTPCAPGPSPRVGIPGSQCSVTDFHFNGATRQPAPGLSFPQATNVRVVVTDANPFLYVYEIEAKEQAVSEASITDFFRLGLGITLANTSGGGKSDGGANDDSGGAQNEAEVCETSAREAAFVDGVAMAKAEHERIGEQFEQLQKMGADADVLLKAQSNIYFNPELLAPEVQAAALRAVGIYDQFATAASVIHQDLDRAVPAWRATVRALSGEQAIIGESPECPDVKLAVQDAGALVRDTAAVTANLATVSQKLEEVSVTRHAMATTANDPGRFYYTSVLQRFDRPTDVTVIVRRKTLAPKDTFHHVASQRINVGGRARFSLSAGLGWTSVGTTTYGLTTRFITPRPGTTDTTNAVVVAKENSDQQIFPMLTFNTRLSPSDLPLVAHLVLGVGLSRANNTALPGYLLGLGADVFNQRLLVTGGVFFGEEHRLGAGLRVGDRVPGGLNPIPMERRMVGKLGVGLTYRMF